MSRTEFGHFDPKSQQGEQMSATPGRGRKPHSRRAGGSLDLGAEAKLAFLSELVPLLARAISPLCEVVVHECTSDPPTIRAIANGHVTGRMVGDLMTKIDVDGTDATNSKSPLLGYPAKTPDGRQLRVSLIPISHQAEVIGYLSFNLLVQDLVVAQQALALLVQGEPRSERIEETFLSPRDVISRIVGEFVRLAGRPVALLDRLGRVDLVQRLRDGGVFGMRGAVDEVASVLGVSRTAVYNYINSAPAAAGPDRS